MVIYLSSSKKLTLLLPSSKKPNPSFLPPPSSKFWVDFSSLFQKAHRVGSPACFGTRLGLQENAFSHVHTCHCFGRFLSRSHLSLLRLSSSDHRLAVIDEAEAEETVNLNGAVIPRRSETEVAIGWVTAVGKSFGFFIGGKYEIGHTFKIAQGHPHRFSLVHA